MKRTLYTLNHDPVFTAYHYNATIGGTIPGNLDQDTKDTLGHAISAYGFLIPRNSKVTAPEFAALILEYSDTDRARVIAATLKGLQP